MPVLVQDPDLAAQLIRDREAAGDHTGVEVWDGVTVIMPLADTEHFDITTFFIWAFRSVFDPSAGDRVQGPCNVSDQPKRWKRNYRNPDVAIFLSGNPAQDRRTHWYGGPDLAIEVVSPDDRSREKLDFYAGAGTREVLIVDRDPWQLELYQLRRGRMQSAGTTKPGSTKKLLSAIGPFEFQLVRGQPRPRIRFVHKETGQEWVG